MVFTLNKLCLQSGSLDLSDTQEEERLFTPLFQRLACGLGHVLNDITRQLLFSFRLVFFMNVLGISAENSGWLALEKQLVHAAMAPVCAVLVDRVHIPVVSKKFGKRKCWHLLGTVLEAVFVPLFFSAYYLIGNEDGQTERMMMIYFGILNVLLGFGGSLLEIAHLSLIPVIAKNQMEAVELSALRTAFTYLSGILTFVVAWVTFGLDSKSNISEDTSKDFMVLTTTLVAAGVLLSLIFHVGTKEPIKSPCMPLRKLSTLAAADLARLTSFISSDLRESMPTTATVIKAVRKESHSSRKSSRVIFCDGIQRTPISNNSNSMGVVNQGFRVSVLDMYSDESNDASHVSKKHAPIIDVPAISVEAINDPLPATKANVLKGAKKESCPSRKMSIVTFRDDIQSSPKKSDTNDQKTLPKKKEPPAKDDLQLCSSSLSIDPNSTCVVDKGRQVSVLERYSDDSASKVTSREAINISVASLETRSAYLSETKEKSELFGKLHENLPRSDVANKTIRSWLTDPRLYMVAIAFSCPNALQKHVYSYLPLFLIHRLGLSKKSIAYIPLITSISASLSSILSKKFVGTIGSKLCFTIAATLVSSAGVMSYFTEPGSSDAMIYPAAILLGLGFSSMYVNSISLATKLIGENKKTSGFVFAFMSFTSYLISGPLVIIIQKLFPEQRGTECEECGRYLQLVFPLVAIALSILGGVAVLLLHCIGRFKEKSSSKNEDPQTSSLPCEQK
ncbi:uncharacterized protein LOC141874047 isoform X2 [Acropora palmata]|uniref:uncharacterized protein LOC141874047 isoform X2 n=1 Tax=Acropora palmata TaxID=6131 RepID=UPI003DA180D4